MIVKINRNFSFIKIAEEVTKKMTDELQDWGDETLLDIRNHPNFPFKTGALNRSINRSFSAKKDGAVLEIGTNIPYAPFQEFGTILRFDASYTSGLSLTSYASQFKGQGIIKTGGIPARRFFFSTVRRNFEDLIVRLNKTLADDSR